MTNRVAIALALLVATGLAADFALQDGAASLFLARKFAEFVEWLAFWR